uniref:Uncharacterized protein n=1 Tax=Percolomonas cosmopolitus TaxID=63605 RepID=A0A7S1PIL8_9EUKA
MDLYTIQPFTKKRDSSASFLNSLYISAEYVNVPYRRNSSGSQIILSENVFYWKIERGNGILGGEDPAGRNGDEVGPSYCLVPFWPEESAGGASKGRKQRVKMYLKAATPNPMLSAFRARWKLV